MIYTTENMYGQRPFDLAQVCSSVCVCVCVYIYVHIYMIHTTQNMYGQRPFDLTHVQILAHVAHTNILIVLQGVFLQ